MLVNIQALVLDTGRNTQAVQFLDSVEEGEATGGSPKVDDEDAEGLSSEETPTVAIQCTIAYGEQAGHQRAQDSAYAMNAASSYRIIDVQTVVDELNGKDENRSANQTNDNCSHRRNHITASSNTYQSSQHAVQGQ